MEPLREIRAYISDMQDNPDRYNIGVDRVLFDVWRIAQKEPKKRKEIVVNPPRCQRCVYRYDRGRG